MDADRRRLGLVAAALVALLFTGRAVVSSIYDDHWARSRVSASRRLLRAGSEADRRPLPANAAAAEGMRERLERALEDIVPRVQYELPPAFAVGAGDSPDLRYIEILRREQRDLVERARFMGRSVPSNLGMPDLNPTGLEDALRALRALHIVHRVVEAALEAGVDAIEEIKTPPVRRRRRVTSEFVRVHRVDFTLLGSPGSLRATLAAMGAGVPYLALDDVRVERVDEDGTRVRGRFAALALVVDTERTVLGTEAAR